MIGCHVDDPHLFSGYLFLSTKLLYCCLIIFKSIIFHICGVKSKHINGAVIKKWIRNSCWTQLVMKRVKSSTLVTLKVEYFYIFRFLSKSWIFRLLGLVLVNIPRKGNWCERKVSNWSREQNIQCPCLLHFQEAWDCNCLEIVDEKTNRPHSC